MPQPFDQSKINPKIETSGIFNANDPSREVKVSLAISGMPIALESLPDYMSEHAAALGNIIIAGSNLERSFQDLLAAIMKGANEEQSRAVIEQVQFRAREQIVQACAEIRNTPVVNKVLSECLGKGGIIKRAKKRRNEIAHGQWCVFQGVNGLILTALDGSTVDPWLIYKLEDHKQSLDWLLEANRTVWDLILCYQNEKPCEFLQRAMPQYL